jgi:hypothetical protein
MALLDAFHDLELNWIDIADGSDAAQDGVHDPRGAMDDKAHGDKSIDNLLDLGFLGSLLHYDKHENQLWHSAASPQPA